MNTYPPSNYDHAVTRAAIQRAIAIVGSQHRLAVAIGVKQQHISNWLLRDKRLPAEHVLPIEHATGGQVSRHELRPDIYPRDCDCLRDIA